MFDELLLLVLLAPALWTDLRAPVAPELYVTDASLSRAGMVRAALPASLGEELWRWADLRGRHSWLEPSLVAVAHDRERLLSPFEARLAQLIAALPCEAVVAYPFRSGDHITLKEALVYKTLVTLLASQADKQGRRYVNAFDSQAVQGAVAKGRSGSYRLNRILRQALPFRVAGGIQLANFFVPSELNPADDLTRDAPLRRGVGLPAWATAVGPLGAGDAFVPHDLDMEGVAQSACLLALAKAGLAAGSFQADGGQSGRDVVAQTRQEPFAESGPVAGATGVAAGPPREARLLEQVPDANGGASAADVDGAREVASAGLARGLIALEVFSGSGRLTGELHARGWQAHALDIVHGAAEDFSRREVRRMLLRKIWAREVAYVHLAPPCSTFSIARTPPIRSRQCPFGLPGLGNRLARFSLQVLKVCLRMEIACTLEQPQSSWMLRLPPFWNFRRRTGVPEVTLDFCMYGEMWRKRTTIIAVRLDLAGLHRR